MTGRRLVFPHTAFSKRGGTTTCTRRRERGLLFTSSWEYFFSYSSPLVVLGPFEFEEEKSFFWRWYVQPEYINYKTRFNFFFFLKIGYPDFLSGKRLIFKKDELSAAGFWNAARSSKASVPIYSAALQSSISRDCRSLSWRFLISKDWQMPAIWMLILFRVSLQRLELFSRVRH